MPSSFTSSSEQLRPGAQTLRKGRPAHPYSTTTTLSLSSELRRWFLPQPTAHTTSPLLPLRNPRARTTPRAPVRASFQVARPDDRPLRRDRVRASGDRREQRPRTSYASEHPVKARGVGRRRRERAAVPWSVRILVSLRLRLGCIWFRYGGEEGGIEGLRVAQAEAATKSGILLSLRGWRLNERWMHVCQRMRQMEIEIRIIDQ